MRYNLNSDGLITEIGNIDNYAILLTNEPFGMSNAFDWRKNMVTGEWIYDPIPQPTENTIEI